MRIHCDFDGTISTEDTTDTVLRALAHPAWESIEADWIAGRLSAAECMRRQIALIQGDEAAIEAVLDRICLRDGFRTFARWCARRGIALTVVSDGVDRFIRQVLARHGLADLPVVANRLQGGTGAWRLGQPWSSLTCAAGSGVCKCRIVRGRADDCLVYVGDGRSDFCVAGEADLLFARGALVEHCQSRGLPYLSFESFAEVQAVLTLHLAQPQGAAQLAAALLQEPSR